MAWCTLCGGGAHEDFECTGRASNNYEAPTRQSIIESLTRDELDKELRKRDLHNAPILRQIEELKRKLK